MRLSRFAVSGVLCAALLISAGCATPVAVDPMADQVLAEMSRTLAEAESFSFTIESIMDDYLEDETLSQWSRRSQVVVHRPNQMFTDVEGDDAQFCVWYDGKTLTVCDETQNQYAKVATEKTVHQLIDAAADRYDLDMPMADFLVDNVRESMMASVQEALYLGKHAVGDDPCHHLAFRQENIDWQLWVSVAKPAVPRKLLIIYKTEPGQPQFEATLSDWNLNAKAEADQFVPKLPEGAQEVSMPELMGIEEGEQP
jgi:hypothetical protein